MLIPGWKFEIHIGSFPLKVNVPVDYNCIKDEMNINGYAKAVTIGKGKSFIGFPQNLVDNYIWEVDELLFNNNLENETNEQREQKHLAIDILRQGKVPKK